MNRGENANFAVVVVGVLGALATRSIPAIVAGPGSREGE